MYLHAYIHACTEALFHVCKHVHTDILDLHEMNICQWTCRDGFCVLIHAFMCVYAGKAVCEKYHEACAVHVCTYIHTHVCVPLCVYT